MCQLKSNKRPDRDFVGIDVLTESLTLPNIGEYLSLDVIIPDDEYSYTLTVQSELPYMHLWISDGEEALPIHESRFDMLMGYEGGMYRDIAFLLDEARSTSVGGGYRKLGKANGFVDSTYEFGLRWKSKSIAMTFIEVLPFPDRTEREAHSIHFDREYLEPLYKLFVNAHEHLLESHKVWHDLGCKRYNHIENITD